MSDVEKTLNQLCTTSMQPFFNVAQHRFNVDMTLSELYLNLESTSIKTLSKPNWLEKSMDLQKG